MHMFWLPGLGNNIERFVSKIGQCNLMLTKNNFSVTFFATCRSVAFLWLIPAQLSTAGLQEPPSRPCLAV